MRSLLRAFCVFLPLLGAAHADPSGSRPAGRAIGFRKAKQAAQALLRGSPAGPLASGAYGYVHENGNVIIQSAPRGAAAAPETRPGQTKRLFSPDEHGRFEAWNTFVDYKNGHQLQTHVLASTPPQYSLFRQDPAGNSYKQRRDDRGRFLPRSAR